MNVLQFNPAALLYEVLPSLNERKGRIIEDINTIQIHLGKGPIDFEQFDMLMECDLEHLTRIVNDQISCIQRAKLGL